VCRDLVGSTTEGKARAEAIERTIEETLIAKSDDFVKSLNSMAK